MQICFVNQKDEIVCHFPNLSDQGTLLLEPDSSELMLGAASSSVSLGRSIAYFLGVCF